MALALLLANGLVCGRESRMEFIMLTVVLFVVLTINRRSSCQGGIDINVQIFSGGPSAPPNESYLSYQLLP